MLFSSVPFLFYFLPCVLLVYFLVPGTLKNGVLLLASLLFYGWGEPRYLLVMLAAIAQGYVFGLLIEKSRGKRRAGLYLALSVLLSLGTLAYFKYADFMIRNLNALTGLSVPLLSLALPVGISFYTFQILSYVIDVYRGDAPAQRGLIDLAAYIAMFPQLVAGPIVRYTDVAPQLQSRTHTVQNAALGARRFVLGLGKKVLLANNIGALWEDIKLLGYDGVSTPLAWLGILAYSLQLYFDFAGYSEMSNGLAALLGFDCPANFDLPYISGSITEFWRRWHITLSGWFRDYIYIPLGGNRKGQARQLFNMFLVWAATGIWHGASWNFIAWGLYYFVLLTIEKTFLLKYLKKGKVWPHLYTLFFVVLGWGLFTANQPGAPLGLLLQKLFVPQGGISAVYSLRNYGVLLALGCVCSSALPRRLWDKISRNTVAKLLVFTLLLVLCVCYVVAATNATALYANF